MKPTHDSFDTSPTPDPTEQRLVRLALRPPSNGLDRRVAALLDASASPVADVMTTAPIAPAYPRRTTASVLFRIGLPLAACLAVGVTLFLAVGPGQPRGGVAVNPPPASRHATVQPVRFDQTITDVEPGQVVIVDDRLPVVPIRQQAIQRARWVDPNNNTEIELTVPSERTLIVPVRVD